MSSRWEQPLLLNSLPATEWHTIADHLDIITATGLGYHSFAAELRLGHSQAYTEQEISLIRARSNGSVTMALLQDYAARGGTIQGVQYALVAIGHVAQRVIPAYIEGLTRTQLARSPPSQYQQTEPGSCQCPQCLQQLNSSGYVSGRSERPGRFQAESRRPVGSINNASFRSASRRSPPGIQVPSPNPNSNTDSTSDEYSRRNYKPINSPVNQGQTFTDERGRMGERGRTGEINAHTSNHPGCIPETVNQSACGCENCRLVSDPEQTQRLTLESDPKSPCRLGQSYDLFDHRDQEPTLQNSNTISDRLSQLYLDSDQSDRSSIETSEHSDETCVKSVCSRTDQESNSNESLNRESVNTAQKANNGKKVCAKSDIGKHTLGEKMNECPVCKSFFGAIPKNGPRQRNSSVSKKTEVTDTELRKSWHGVSEHNQNESMRKISSDSLLSVRQSQNVICNEASSGSLPNSIEATIYSRISPHNSLGWSSETRLPNTNSHDSSERISSELEIYQNNLQSGSANHPYASERNIIPSDSSNCSVQQNRQPVNSPNRDHIQANRGQLMDSQGNGDKALGDTPNRRRDSDRQPRNIDTMSMENAGRSNLSWDSDERAMNSHLNRARKAERSGDFVFVTYSWNGATDREEFIGDVINLCKELRRRGVRVKIDMDDTSYNALRLNKLDWVDRNVREAKYVIVCLTPTYAMDIKEPGPRDQASPRSSQLNARYIYDKLRDEYYRNNSQNRRTIPVMFTNYGMTENLTPPCMRSTLVYKYPSDVAEIIAAVLGYGRFQPS